MALTNEILKANTALAGLTDEQLTAITTLSANDENTVIGKHTGEIYRKMDDTIATVTGIARNGDEKTYNYLERAAVAFKEKADKVGEYETKVQELEATKARLEKTIADGTQDAETKKQLDQATADLNAVRTQFNTLTEETNKLKENHATELFNIKVGNDISKATSGLKFKSDLPESVTKILLENTVKNLQSAKPEYIDDGKGGQILVFKDETGAHMRNPENGLNFYSAEELMKKELKDVLEVGGKQGGAGSGPSGSGGSGGSTLTVSGAKNRVEAHNIIHQGLTAKGLTVGSDQYQKELTEAYKDNGVMDLPVQ